MAHTVKTLEAYYEVAVREAEYWGTDPVAMYALEPWHPGLYVLILPADHEPMMHDLCAEYEEQGMLKSFEWHDKHQAAGTLPKLVSEHDLVDWNDYATMWLIVAADLEQRIAAMNGSK